jgi:hypothetical protein
VKILSYISVHFKVCRERNTVAASIETYCKVIMASTRNFNGSITETMYSDFPELLTALYCLYSETVKILPRLPQCQLW